MAVICAGAIISIAIALIVWRGVIMSVVLKEASDQLFELVLV